ncbi:hypothetical protein ACHAWF_006233, partial [Thalassiosira exigua]
GKGQLVGLDDRGGHQGRDHGDVVDRRNRRGPPDEGQVRLRPRRRRVVSVDQCLRPSATPVPISPPSGIAGLLPGENEAVHRRPQGCRAASRTLRPSPPGHEILSVNDHCVRDAWRCAETLRHYARSARGRREGMEVVASGGPRPAGARYLMVKRTRQGGRGSDATSPTLPDGSLQGLFLSDDGGKVRVARFGDSGIFVGARVNRGDVLLSIDGRIVESVDDCRRALGKALANSDRTLVPVLTYNPFRKFRSSIVVRATTSRDRSRGTLGTSVTVETGKRAGGSCVGDLYAFGPIIGTGGYSVVRKCKLKETDEMYTVKIVSRKVLNWEVEQALKHEISVVNLLNHPHIIRLYDTFVTINTYYLVTEYLEGGELFDRIVQKTTYTESEARDATYVILDAVHHIHSCGIAHRDLKPENLLLRSKDDDRDLKVADFGFAKWAPNEDSLATLCGSPGYVSPEILREVPYGTKTDMWSIGVIVFILLGGYPPFQRPDQAEQFERIKCGTYEFVESYWGTVTDEAKSLIRSLLDTDPRRRLSAEEALNHPWMRADARHLRRSSLMAGVRGMREFNSRRKFKSAVRSVSGAVAVRLGGVAVCALSSVFLYNRYRMNDAANDLYEAGDDIMEDEDMMDIDGVDVDGSSGLKAIFSMRQKRNSLCLPTGRPVRCT